MPFSLCFIEVLYLIGMTLYLIGTLIIIYEMHRRKNKKRNINDFGGFTFFLFIFLILFFPFSTKCKISNAVNYLMIIIWVVLIAAIFAIIFKIFSEV